MSDGTRRKQTLKINMKSRAGSPRASRGASPDRGPAVVPPARTGTPGKPSFSPSDIQVACMLMASMT